MSAAAVRDAVDALNAGDVDGYGAAFHPDALRTVPGVPEPLPAAVVLDSLRDLHAAFDGFRLDALLLIESGNYVIARWRTTGVHTGPYLGIEPTGRPIDSETCEIYEFRDDKVARSWSYGDPGTVFTQLGHTDAG
ncbi:MAG: ester cyclase [Acidimicrobiia bacterium]